MLSSTLLVAVALFAVPAQADKDSNPYPWGSNPNNAYKMYWKDSPNVLEDLDQFSALYIKIHNGCVWSEYGLGTSYDDDGENHDGDEQWYMTRTQPFRANTAFSLYGTLRSGFSGWGGNCNKKTYINSFFTLMGADTIVDALNMGVQAFPDNDGYGAAYCYEYDGESQDDDESGSGDNNDDNEAGSTTMGCKADGTFVTATFSGDDCDGNYFMNITDDLDDYNQAMNKASCQQVWNYKKNYVQDASRRALKNADSGRALEQNDDAQNDDNAAAQQTSTYGSIAETLLMTSFACDLELYPNGQCPDPYGLKLKYDNNMKAAASGSRSSFFASAANATNSHWQTPIKLLSWMFVMVGIFFAMFSYSLANKETIKKNGGGVVGFVATAWAGVQGAVVNSTVRCLTTNEVDDGSGETAKKRKKKSSRSSGDKSPRSEKSPRSGNRTRSSRSSRKSSSVGGSKSFDSKLSTAERERYSPKDQEDDLETRMT
jgi:hypothetical protein